MWEGKKMQLASKKDLAARTLNVGKSRVVFNKERLDEIKEAITKQDIKDLLKDKAIIVKEIKGTKKKVKRKTRRRLGSVKKKVNTRKKEYMTITRKLRAYIAQLRKHGTIKTEEFWNLRKEIRARNFRSKAHIKERIQVLIKEREE
jgi:large subunit ribosomal protein L19e